ncbi:MAG: single-stranded DNA-binding protein [Clostridia bacterium]|nr:single-stranded DNA-binding protein [Clostridia bacterium]
MNKVILIGNLTRDPEMSQTSNNVAITKMSIAVNRKFTSANSEREADYFIIFALRGLAEKCAKFLIKGKKISVIGSLQNRSYEDNNGNKKQVTEVMADEIEFLSPVGEEAQQQQGQTSKRSINDLKPVDEDGLPF